MFSYRTEIHFVLHLLRLSSLRSIFPYVTSSPHTPVFIFVRFLPCNVNLSSLSPLLFRESLYKFIFDFSIAFCGSRLMCYKDTGRQTWPGNERIFCFFLRFGNLNYLKILFTPKKRTQAEDFQKYDFEKRKKKKKQQLQTYRL